MADQKTVKVELSGGTELLFDNKKHMVVALHGDRKDWTIGDLIKTMTDEYIKERKELFSIGSGKIRPGILVLVNDVDYEILGGHEYIIKPNDTVVFISTLHGG